MATRVNSRFILVLSTVLAVVLVVALGLGYMAVKKSGEQLVAQGDAAMAEEEYKRAALLYSKAVNKDQANGVWIRKWIEAIEAQSPEQRVEFSKRYGELMLAMRGLAQAEPDNLESQELYVGEHFRRVERATSGDALDNFISDVETLTQYREDDEIKTRLMRYRGLARVRMLEIGSDVDSDAVAQARQDLERALEATPNDEKSVVGLARWHVWNADESRRLGRDEAYEQELARAELLLREFLASNSPAPEATLELFGVTLRSADRDADNVDTGLLEQAVGQVLATPPEQLDPMVVSNVAFAARSGLQDQPELVDQVIAHAKAARPDDTILMLTEGQTALQAGEPERAIELLQRVVDLPDRNVGLDGLMLFRYRDMAVKAQLDAQIVIAERERKDFGLTSPECQDALDAALALRDEFATRMGETDALVALSDAKIAFLRDERQRAQGKLNEYLNGVQRPEFGAMVLQADLHRAAGNRGAALEWFQRAAEDRPGNDRVLRRVAELAITVDNLELAADTLDRLARMFPDDEALADQLSAVIAMERGRGSEDPVLGPVLEARELLLGADADPRAALMILDEAVRDIGADDPRIALLAARAHLILDERALALTRIERGLEDFPNDGRLARLRDALVADNPMETALQAIETAEMPEAQKLISRSRVYEQFDMPAEAETERALAYERFPTSSAVLEDRFARAVSENDLDEARAVADRAAELNADGAEGLSYLARVDYLEENFEEAAASLEEAVAKNPGLVGSWRLLGVARGRLSQHDKAAEAFRGALEVRPSDAMSGVRLLRSLISLDRAQEALQEARQRETLLGSNPEFADLWLRLEATTPGGDRALALEERRRLIRSSDRLRDAGIDVLIRDVGHRVAVISLLQDQGRRAEARAEIDAAQKIAADARARGGTDEPRLLEAESNQLRQLELQLVTVSALWHARGGQYSQAVGEFEAWIDAQDPADLTSMPFLSLSKVLEQAAGERNVTPEQRSELLEASEQVLRDGVEYQSTDRREVDVEMARRAFARGDMETAAQRYGAAMESATGDLTPIRLQYAEALTRLSRLDEAREQLELCDLGTETERSQALMIRAQMALAQQDLERVTELLDQAVEAAPSNPTAFMMRARVRAQNEATRGDAISDLERALSLAPGLTSATELLYNLYLADGEPDRALQALRNSLEWRPANRAVRLELANALMRQNRVAEANAVYEEGVQRNPTDTEWMMVAGDFFRRSGSPEKARQYFRQAWTITRGPTPAIQLLNMISDQPRIDRQSLARADEIIRGTTPGAEENNSLRMARARLLAEAGQNDAALADTASVWLKIDQNSASEAMSFFNILPQVFAPEMATPEAAAANRDRLAQIVDALGTQPLGPQRTVKSFENWGIMGAARVWLGSNRTAQKGLAALQDLAANAEDPALRVSAHNQLAEVAYASGQFEAAAQAYRAVLEIDADDPRAHNNLAYTLARELNRAEDGLSHARRAAELTQNTDPNILDTLATCLRLTGNPDDGLQTAAMGLRVARSAEDQLQLSLTATECHVDRNDMERARGVLSRVKDAVEQNPALAARFSPRIKELEERIGR